MNTTSIPDEVDVLHIAGYDAYHQKKGVAQFMINELMTMHPDSIAKVKIDNEASLNLFQSCGFAKKYYILERE